MLRKEDSKKVLKGIKAIVFATSFSLLNPVNTYGSEIIPQYSNQEVNPLDVTTSVLNGVSLVIFVSTISSIIIGHIHNKKLSHNHINIYLGKLSDKESKDDIGKAVKYLKLTNGLEER